MNERPVNINAELPETIQRKDGETVDSLVVKQDKNGTDRIYTLNEAGKHEAISANAIVEAYGYDPNQTQDSNDPFTPDPTATSIDTTPERPDQDLYDEYAEAVKDESATVRVRNPETGKMEVTKVKDLNFREWIKQSEMRKAAKWYTATRAHGEGLVEGIDYATEAPLPLDLTNEELDKLDNTEHAEQLNAREGKPNPSNDDVEYYRWQKNAEANATPEQNSDEAETQEVPIPNTVEDVLKDLEDSTYLDRRRSSYAYETAKSRKSYLGRFAQGNSRVGKLFKKIHGVQKMIDGANARTDVYTPEARQDYELAFDTIGMKVAAAMEAAGYDEETIRAYAAAGQAYQNLRLEDAILAHRQGLSKDTNKFVNWWVNANGIKGKLGKAGVVFGASLITGASAGLLAPAFLAGIAGMTVGGATGAGIANHVTKRRANAVLESGATVAQQQSMEDRASKEHAIDYMYEKGIETNVRNVTARTEERTGEEMLGNRKRLRQAAAIGKLAGGFSGLMMFRALHNAPKPSVDAVPKPPTETAPKPPVESAAPKPPVDAAPVKPPAPEVIKGQDFIVEPGNGFTHEIQDFAQANGTSVDPNKAFQIYNDAVAKFGKDGLIEPLNTYQRVQGDFGISAPGGASWKPGVAEFLKSRI